MAALFDRISYDTARNTASRVSCRRQLCPYVWASALSPSRISAAFTLSSLSHHLFFPHSPSRTTQIQVYSRSTTALMSHHILGSHSEDAAASSSSPMMAHLPEVPDGLDFDATPWERFDLIEDIDGDIPTTFDTFDSEELSGGAVITANAADAFITAQRDTADPPENISTLLVPGAARVDHMSRPPPFFWRLHGQGWW